MLKYTTSDVLVALDKAKNTNAALKKFLKNEVRADPKSEKFIKNLKSVLNSKDPGDKESFIENSLPAYEPHLFVLTRYAYAEQTAALAEEITTKYADEFNATYKSEKEGITVQDEAKFKKIVLEVNSIIDEGLEKHSMPKSGFMKNVMFHQIFDKEVLDEVIPIARKAS